ncbi:hypothetical protein AMECASPLE_020348 [Ameca splendens]|uniref:Uncharacterized protein n=1 Tax=Ameca splendens TaxID=208324 RepID=A0ABV0YQP5_9TELE
MNYLPILLCKPAQAQSYWIKRFYEQQCLILATQLDLHMNFDRAFVANVPFHCSLAVCLGSLSIWKVNLHLSVKCFVALNRFYSRIAMHFESDQLSCPSRRKTSPQHDAATTMFLSEKCSFRVMCSVKFLSHTMFLCRAKVDWIALDFLLVH